MKKYIVFKGSENGMERLSDGTKQKDFSNPIDAVEFAISISGSDASKEQTLKELSNTNSARIVTGNSYIHILRVPEYTNSSFMAICPKCKDHQHFITTAHVVQEWVVDAYGEFQEVNEDCIEVAADPCIENTWSCNECGSEAIMIDI